MCRKLVYLVSFVLVLSLCQLGQAQGPVPDVGWWQFDEGSGTTAVDSSGQGNDGTIAGADWVSPGVKEKGYCLDFVYGQNDRVSIGTMDVVGGGITLTAWVRPRSFTQDDARIISKATDSAADTHVWMLSTTGGPQLRFRLRTTDGQATTTLMPTSGQLPVDEWALAAATWDGSTMRIYDNAVEVGSTAKGGNAVATDPTVSAAIGNQPADVTGGTRDFDGLIDDVRIYSRALSQSELRELMKGLHPKAYDPDPPDGAENVTSLLFQWQPGENAAFHDVYFGTNPTPGQAEFQGRQPLAMYWHAPGLIPGTTYYWRIDEVEADGVTIHTGDVWSFTSAPGTAQSPDPADGAIWVDADADLSWSAGMNAITHDIYFGTNEADVAASTGGTFKTNQLWTTYDPGTLAGGTTYYWRIDEVEADGTTKHAGQVWRFKTKPQILMRDPNLVGWWKMDDVGTGTVVDYSGYGRDGTLHGNPTFVPGYYAEALDFHGNPDYATIDGFQGVLRISNNLQHAFTITAWIRTTDADGCIVSWGNPSGRQRVEFRTNGGRLRVEHGAGNKRGDTDVDDDQWHHVVLVVPEGATINDTLFYLDGQPEPHRTVSDGDLFNITANFPVTIARRYNANERWYNGLIDDVRIYDVALTQEGILYAMAGDPMLAGNPNPANMSTPDIEHATPLSWSPGEIAVQHDVYFGTDANAVAAAETSDTTGIYQGRQDANSYIPPEGVEMEQNYYWRIDELNTDGTISTGDVWNFTVPNYLIVDDMESYTDDVGSRIFQTWIDGFGFTEPAPGNPGNNTGSTVGNTTAPFAEQTIVNNGIQSMPFDYSNVTAPFYSETDRTFDIPQDWTRHGVKSLTLWFRGYPQSVSSFTEEPPGTYTLAVRSPDNISGTSDEFLFAYKQLNGLGSIIAKVEWVKDADDNAQAGIMIRDTLDPDSAHAAVLLETNDIAADADLRFRCRTATGGDSTTTTVDGILAPQWLKLERFMGDTFRAYYSTDGANWVEIGSSQTVPMAADVYVGLVVASDNAGITCEAEFSNVTITGTVIGQWQSRDVGIINNDPESVYVAIANSGGTPAVVYYEDPDDPDAIPTQFGGWTQWNIDLKQFADKGVNLAAVKKMFIGVGDRGNPQLGGTGTLYVDDIRLYVPRCLPDLVHPAADLSNNCIVDHPDLEIMTADWLKSDAIVSTVAPDPAGLMLHYKFDGNAHDSSGNNYHGIEKDGPTYVDGKFGQAIRLDGFDDYVAIQDMNYVGTGYPEVSVCAWIRTSDSDAGIIASFDRSEFWRLEINGAGGGPGQVGWDVWSVTANDFVDYGSNRRVDDGQWHHVAGVFDNGMMIIYIDGSPEQPHFSPDSTFGRDRYVRYGFVGSNSEASYPPPTGRPDGAYFEGDVDEFYVYHRALSQAEIAYLADDTPDDGELYITVPSVANLFDEEPILSKSVNFRDIAVLVGQWLDEQLWPAE